MTRRKKDRFRFFIRKRVFLNSLLGKTLFLNLMKYKQKVSIPGWC